MAAQDLLQYKRKLNEANINQPIVEEIIDGVFGGDLI